MEGQSNQALTVQDEDNLLLHGSTQPELSSLDCAPGSHSIEINRDKADVFVTEELCQKENSSEQLDSSHKDNEVPSSEFDETRENVSQDKGRFWNHFPDYRSATHTVLIWILHLCVLAYVITAVVFWKSQGERYLEWCDGLGMLIIIVVLVYVALAYYHIKKHYGKTLYNIFEPVHTRWRTLMEQRYTKIIIFLLPFIAIVVYLGVDTIGSSERLISCLGTVVIMGLGFMFSKHRTQVQWHTVLSGLVIQFVLGLITIRWSVGRSIFQCIGDKVSTFLAYTDVGSTFVYGNLLIDNGYFAFKSLSVIFFLSFCVQILYYYGAMQWVIMKVGWLLQKSMGTTACESLNAVASIFLGMTESPLLFKPYIANLTKSEIHAVMTEGFATVAGTVMAAYINFGVEPSHLLTASIMSAPASLCVSKLFYPETEQSKTTVGNMVLEKGDENSVLDAATKGVLLGIQLVLGIIANLIAFVSFVAFFNGVLSWLGVLVGVENLTLEFILGKVFIPLAWIMGVEWDNCEEVARLVGIKTIINEFVAYEQMGKSKAAGLLTPRSEMIATYALCGFSNLGSIGILVGGLVSMAPERRGAITEVAFRAFIAGSATCFLTASIAGMLTADEDLLPSAVTMPEFDT